MNDKIWTQVCVPTACRSVLADNNFLYAAKINFMNEKIKGRVEEAGILAKALHSADPEFIAVYGRRRVGKTSSLP
jgi:hypothetical protein